MSRKLIEQAGGKDALSFGMGKSNAKVYVQSTQGIHFNDVAGEDEAKENLKEIVDYLHNPDKYHRGRCIYAERHIAGRPSRNR